MPTYQYACTECGHRFEAVQTFHEDSLTHCPECDGRLRKVFNAVGVVFKGSGFYRTDSRAGATGEKSSSSDSGSTKDSGASSDKQSGKGSDKGSGTGSDKGSGEGSGKGSAGKGSSGDGGSSSSSSSSSGSSSSSSGSSSTSS